MEPRNGFAPFIPVYETGVSLSTLTGPSIACNPIIVKHKSVPAPFGLLGSPQQDWGSGSLPPRYMIIWSGRVDLNHRFLPSEGRGSTRLSYALVMERVAVLATASSAWKAEAQLLYQTRICLLSWSGRRESNPRGLPWQGSTYHSATAASIGAKSENRTPVTSSSGRRSTT